MVMTHVTQHWGSKGKIYPLEWVYEQNMTQPKGWLKNWCENNNLPYDGVKQKLYRYRLTINQRKDKYDSIGIFDYDKLIEYCKDNPEIPFTDVILDRVEGHRKRDKSFLKAVLSIQKTML